MKIHGTDALVNRVIITLPRATGDLSVTVRALPLGWTRAFAALVPVVAAPLKATGKHTNSGPEMAPDFDDVEWRKAFADRSDLSTFFMLHLVLKESPEIELTTKVISSREDISAFRAELEVSGLSDGDLNRINAAIMQVSNLGDQEVAARKAGF